MREIALFIISGVMLITFFATLFHSLRLRVRADQTDEYTTDRAYSFAYLVLSAVSMFGAAASYAAARGYIE